MILGSEYMDEENKKIDEIDDEEELATKSQNEIDPRLRFDAFTAGMKMGGLRSVTSIQFLVCYIIATINGKVKAENIIQAVDEGMLANHFEISNAIATLIKKGTIVEAEDGALTLAVNDKELLDFVERDLPLTVRETAIMLCQKVIAKETYKRENKVELKELENETYEITLHISDGQIDYMTLTLYAPTREQAELIKDKFITNPVRVYENLITGIITN